MDIELKQIHKRFGSIHANNDISLRFAGGRIIGVLGENGAGKSTLMKILSGFQEADSGDILLDGKRAAYHDPRSAIDNGIGMLQQDPLDIAAFTVLENFLYGQSINLSLNRSAAKTKLAQMSKRFGFELDPDTPAAQLSIAQRQQLEIIHLLSLGVKMLILDEPTTGISASQKQVLFDTLRELVKIDGMTVLLVSHKLEDVIALCDEVVVLRAGQVVGAAQMPVTTSQLVRLMFGDEAATPERQSLVRGNTVLALMQVQIHGKRVHLQDCNFELGKQEVVGLAGLEGSGQELFLRACAGLVAMQRGSVHINNRQMTGKPYREFARAGVVFAPAGRIEEGLIAGLTLTEHMALVTERATLINWNRAEQFTRRQIELYDVRGKPDDRIEKLSGGNQQRTLIALLPENPTALILEQPTRGLDVESARWIWQQLLERRARGAAILFSSAELEEIIVYSDRILVFYAGRMVEVINPAATSVEQLGNLMGGNFQ